MLPRRVDSATNAGALIYPNENEPLRSMNMAAVSSANYQAGVEWRVMGHRLIIARAARYLGAVAVLVTGVAHFEQYAVDNYSTVPTIGTLFLLNFTASIAIAVGLIAPVGRVAGRYTDAVRPAIAIYGIGLGALSLVALFVSETAGLFGFVEHGYRMAIVVSIVAEAAAVAFLGAFLVANGLGLQAIRASSR
jgi:hypothetical protein